MKRRTAKYHGQELATQLLIALVRRESMRLLIERSRETGDGQLPRPNVGDLVVETTQFVPDHQSVGWLRKVSGKPGLETWDVEPLYRPGRVERWHNAEFRTVPWQVLDLPPGKRRRWRWVNR